MDNSNRGKGKSKKGTIIVLIILLLLILAFLFPAFTSFKLYGMCFYQKNIFYCDFEAERFMPSVEYLGDYEDAKFTYYRVNHNKEMLTSSAYTLKVTYDSESFEQMKAKIESDYNIVSSDYSLDGNTVYQCKWQYGQFPIEVGMIEYNENTVCFMYYYDDSGNEEDVQKIINEYFT